MYYELNITNIINQNYQKYYANPYPIPISDIGCINLPNETNEYTLSIFSIDGSKVKVLSGMEGNKIMIQKNSFESGLYFFELETNTGEKIIGNFLIE